MTDVSLLPLPERVPRWPCTYQIHPGRAKTVFSGECCLREDVGLSYDSNTTLHHNGSALPGTTQPSFPVCHLGTALVSRLRIYLGT